MMNQNQSKTIAYVTDIHLGQHLQMDNALGDGKMSYSSNPDEHKENFILILDDIKRRGIKEIIFGGDIGTKDANPWFFDKIKEYHFKLFMVLGNHDTFSTASQYYNNGLTDGRNEMMYSFEENHFKCIVLDSSNNIVSKTQLDWLEWQLNTPKKVLLFIHHPVLKISTLLDEIGAALRERDRLKKILIDSTSDITIFCGHYHMSDEATEKNIKQITSVAASYQILKGSTKIETDQNKFGYMLVQIEDNSIKYNTIYSAYLKEKSIKTRPIIW